MLPPDRTWVLHRDLDFFLSSEIGVGSTQGFLLELLAGEAPGMVTSGAEDEQGPGQVMTTLYGMCKSPGSNPGQGHRLARVLCNSDKDNDTKPQRHAGFLNTCDFCL